MIFIGSDLIVDLMIDVNFLVLKNNLLGNMGGVVGELEERESENLVIQVDEVWGYFLE